MKTTADSLIDSRIPSRKSTNLLTISEGGGGGGVWTPASISGLKLWVEGPVRNLSIPFNWSGQYLSIPTPITVGNFTAFVKFKILADSASNGYFWGSETGGNYDLFGLDDSAYGMRLRAGGAGAYFGTKTRTQYYSGGQYHTVCITRNGTTANWDINNGEESGNITVGSSNLLVEYVNDYAPSIGRRFPGYVPLRLIYDSVLSASDVALIHSYAAGL